MSTDSPAARVNPFSLRSPAPVASARERLPWAAVSAFAPALERALGLYELSRLYEQARSQPDSRPFPERALDLLNIGIDVAPAELGHVPAAGRLVVVANHPFGAVDGLVAAVLLRRIRPDVKFLGNTLLAGVPELREYFFFVDPFGRRTSVPANSQALLAAARHVRRGGALGVFPAGEVSHLTTSERAIVDPPWHAAIGALVRQTAPTVVPMFFEGANSTLFRLAGTVHPRLRTALLPRELLRQRHRRIAVRIGAPVPADRIAQLGGADQISGYLRARTYALAERDGAAGPALPKAAAVIRASASDALAAEIARVPDCTLLEAGALSVICAPADRIPVALGEIGRLREIAFREVGEGTGRAVDLDRYDAHYQHLFVWNAAQREILAAYRLAASDDVCATRGLDGLYTRELFRYDERLLRELGPAIELGRAFVRPECQRDYTPLLLLWKGIGRFVAAHPKYRVLFGPVSISSAYGSMSRRLLMAFLYNTRYRSDLADLVAPRHPPALRPDRLVDPLLRSVVVRSLQQVAALVGDLESDGKGLPVLLRQYLKLNAKLIAFNIDPAFGHALDGLMFVDLTSVDRAILSRYMGAAQAGAFLAYHGTNSATA